MSNRAQPGRESRSVAKEWFFEREFALRFAACSGRPLGSAYCMLLENEDISGALSVRINPSDYQEPKHFAEDYQIAELLTKSRNVPCSSDEQRQVEAQRKFLSAEEANRATNHRLWCEPQPEWFGTFSYWVLRILGPLTSDVLSKIQERSDFGPGVAVGVRGDGLVKSKKFDAIPVCTPALYDMLPGLLDCDLLEYWGDVKGKARVVEGNAHFTVPKSWKVDRCAAKEPLWNSKLQLGIGRFMADRLKRFGVDLQDQRVNQFLASKAHEWTLATLDLSSASDYMCSNLVTLALTFNGDENGRRWLHLLRCARSPRMRMPNKMTIDLEMFSSMGNGFTFPLETIIFLALIMSVVPPEDRWAATAYGDDLIVPRDAAPALIERLEYCGFKVNREKTCLAGTFFESCGTDWFGGQNVRPFYLRKDPDNRIPYPLLAANLLRAWCIRVYGYLPDKYAPLWRWCKSQIPYAWRHPIPSQMGHCGLHVSISEARAQGVKRASGFEGMRGWEGWLVRHTVLTPVKTDRRTFGVLAVALRTAGLRSNPGYVATHGHEPVRGLFGTPCTTWSVAPLEWDDFAWIR